MLARTNTFRIKVDAQLVSIEADVRRGLPSFRSWASPDTAAGARARPRHPILNED